MLLQALPHLVNAYACEKKEGEQAPKQNFKLSVFCKDGAKKLENQTP